MDQSYSRLSAVRFGPARKWDTDLKPEQDRESQALSDRTAQLRALRLKKEAEQRRKIAKAAKAAALKAARRVAK